MNIKYRIDIDDVAMLVELQTLVRKYSDDRDLIDLVENPKHIEWSRFKCYAALRASWSRRDKTRKKVEDAVSFLNKAGEDITPYRVSKVSGVSYNTAKKYLKVLNDD